MDQDTMRRRVEAARVGRLATVGGDGAPHVVPICFALVADVAYSAVDQKPKRGPRLRRLANIEASGLASLVVDEYREDWSTLWWVRLDGRARVVEDAAESGEAIGALVAKVPCRATVQQRCTATEPAGWNRMTPEHAVNDGHREDPNEQADT